MFYEKNHKMLTSLFRFELVGGGKIIVNLENVLYFVEDTDKTMCIVFHGDPHWKGVLEVKGSILDFYEDFHRSIE